jgi:hypothetical protein
MKKHLMILILVLSSLTAAIAQQGGEFAVPLSDPAKRARLKVHLNSGSITVKGTARKDVLVKYVPTKGEEHDHDDEEDEEDRKGSREGLKRISSGTIDLEVSEEGNEVKVNSDAWNNGVDVEIEAPSGADIDLHTYNNGEIVVSGIQGEVELTNYNGEITANNISGSVVANTYNGEIIVTFDRVTADKPMSFSTYNGDIDITLPAAAKASLKMKTNQGEVYTGFDVALTKSGPVQKKETRPGTYKVVVDEWLRGDINGGGPEFMMKNYHGDIYVRKK